MKKASSSLSSHSSTARDNIVGPRIKNKTNGVLKVVSINDQIEGDKHLVLIIENSAAERKVEFTFEIKRIKDYQQLYNHVFNELNYELTQRKYGYKYVTVTCDRNERKTRAVVHVVVQLFPTVMMLSTAPDVFFYYLEGLTRAGYTIRRTTTFCHKRCLERSAKSVREDYSEQTRALFLDENSLAIKVNDCATCGSMSTSASSSSSSSASSVVRRRILYRRHSDNQIRRVEEHYLDFAS